MGVDAGIQQKTTWCCVCSENCRLFNTALEFLKLVYQDSVPAFGAAVVFPAEWDCGTQSAGSGKERRGGKSSTAASRILRPPRSDGGRDCVEERLRSSVVRGDAVENACPARGEALGRVPQRRRVLWPGVVAQTCSQNLWPRAAFAAGTAGCSTLLVKHPP